MYILFLPSTSAINQSFKQLIGENLAVHATMIQTLGSVAAILLFLGGIAKYIHNKYSQKGLRLIKAKDEPLYVGSNGYTYFTPLGMTVRVELEFQNTNERPVRVQEIITSVKSATNNAWQLVPGNTTGDKPPYSLAPHDYQTFGHHFNFNMGVSQPATHESATEEFMKNLSLLPRQLTFGFVVNYRDGGKAKSTQFERTLNVQKALAGAYLGYIEEEHERQQTVGNLENSELLARRKVEIKRFI